MLAEAAATDAVEAFPAETFKDFAEIGLSKAVLPKRFGGLGIGIENASTFALLALLKTLGRSNLVAGRIYEGHFNAVQLISEYATEAQAECILTRAASENHLFGVWNTEVADGVKIVPAANDKFRLEGAKTFASGIGYVNRPIITGRTADGGWQMFIVPLDEVETKIDASWWRPLGMQASRSYRIDLTGVEIGRTDLIGAANDYYREPFFSGGAIRFAAVQLGAAEFLLDATKDFLREINRADDAFQRLRVAETAISVEGGNLFLEKAARLFDDYAAGKNPDSIAQLINYVGMARTNIERACLDAIERAARSIGSRGLMKTHHFERVIRDLTMYLRQAAPDAVLQNVGRFVLENDAAASKLWNAKNE